MGVGMRLVEGVRGRRPPDIETAEWAETENAGDNARCIRLVGRPSQSLTSSGSNGLLPERGAGMWLGLCGRGRGTNVPPGVRVALRDGGRLVVIREPPYELTADGVTGRDTDDGLMAREKLPGLRVVLGRLRPAAFNVFALDSSSIFVELFHRSLGAATGLGPGFWVEPWVDDGEAARLWLYPCFARVGVSGA